MLSKKFLIISVLSTIVQFYDYAIFGLLASKLASVFFSNEDHIDNILSFFYALMITSFARPIGAIIFGTIGDKFGRARSLKIATLGIIIPTLITGLIPSYDSIGISATYILMICRITVIIFLAGEIDGIKLYVNEHVNKERMFFANGLVFFGTQCGTLIASLSALIFTLESLPNWAWRICFFLGGIMGLGIIYLRSFLIETAEFKRFLESNQYLKISEIPLYLILWKNKTKFLKAAVILGSMGTIYQFYIIFFTTYSVDVLKIISPKEGKITVFICILTVMIFGPIAGFIYDKMKYKHITSISIILLIAISIQNIINLRNLEFPYISLICTAALMPFFQVPLQVKMIRKFSTGIKYRMYSLAHSIGSVTLSSSTATISLLLWNNTLVMWIPIIYVIFITSILLHYST